MRPVVLDMNGFAAFRAPARVDFTDASFFALVGPTGSGKSTVIDAMTFALYGSVPRWGRRGMVSLALAPTTGRGTVRLVFEAADQRYVVARELRRIGANVSQRAATLERITEPGGLAGPGEPTEVLAKDRGVAEAVERLLGLSYDDFCQCVVLPQGQFAAFLHAKPGDRQEILLRLLGAEHYRQMMMRANQRASAAGQRADALGETLATFADATPEAQDAAQAAEKTLDVLNERVRLALPEIDAARRDLAEATAELERMRRERATLAAVRVPEGTAALDTHLAAARVRLDEARTAERQAADADTAARQALAGGPQRAPLELARQRRQERGRCEARRPELERDVTRLAEAARRADEAVTGTETGLEQLRSGRDQAALAAEAAEQAVRELSTAHATLADVTVPDGVSRLDERERTATAAMAEAREHLEAAERAGREARAAADAAVGLGLLERAERDLGELRDLAPAADAAQEQVTRAGEERRAADTALEAAEADRRARQDELDEARRTHLAADLRTHLVAGQPCPVCEQPVATRPGPLDARAVEEARGRLDQTDAAAERARKRAAAAVAAEAKAASDLEGLSGQRARHLKALAALLSGPLAKANLTAVAGFVSAADFPAADGTPVADGSSGADDSPGADGSSVAAALAEVTTALQSRRSLDDAVRKAAAGLDAARRQDQAAREALGVVQAEAAQARRALHAARDRLVGLGAPPTEDDSLAAAWTALSSWAAEQARERVAELASARSAAEAAGVAQRAAETRFAAAEADLARQRTEAARAARAQQEARTRLDELTSRIGELDRLLGDAPEEAEITAELARRDDLEAAAADAEQRLITARAGRGGAEKALAELERAGSAARARLSAARDPLVVLGAPALDDASLLTAWTTLASWASGAAAIREEGVVAAGQRVSLARSLVDDLTGRLRAGLADGGIHLAPDAIPATAARAVLEALGDARAATRRLTERRAEAADLAAKWEAAHEEQGVAKMLADMLRSDRFPRWLVTAAVDTLVEFASGNLADLSGGQFDLTHTDGEFYVIDHADADSRRSVRTLSGGETFQASLALALALSSQMSSLSAAGGARLDSIFLDEGFGTLDPETLDVVAATLETLAQDDRMVGVITHVAALAERVPVRFQVSRDAKTSTVVREGLPPAEEVAP
ncbi:MAG TPA: SMC family ATPase [Streptosporangiaceae bacterium]|nr:SMC family ATPase [Streptosporangiaceae bacterium]